MRLIAINFKIGMYNWGCGHFYLEINTLILRIKLILSIWCRVCRVVRTYFLSMKIKQEQYLLVNMYKLFYVIFQFPLQEELCIH